MSEPSKNSWSNAQAFWQATYTEDSGMYPRAVVGYGDYENWSLTNSVSLSLKNDGPKTSNILVDLFKYNDCKYDTVNCWLIIQKVK